ncbi:hypothetical protein [Psychrobacillus vulpis]|uniref:Uncharacterized protein n=1 Tax=Psychrobacillus vulpis TaxID=2325572 RepID=A0A544TMN3_9BACI|nr:hypothetical protein [Psychrobacillus vulpis]TQR18698.1 hypothetical protein FG384_15745 [Psychrobacillus vulpis]
MGRESDKGADNHPNSLPQLQKNPNARSKNAKEEISLELAELGNLMPKQEPMTPNQRRKNETEKRY